MAMDTTTELLAQVPIFQGLTQAQIGAIAAAGKKCFFEAGETIIRSGEDGSAAYLILSGRARVSEPVDPAADVNLLPGSFTGELAMLVEMTYSTTVVASERIRALSIQRSALLPVMEADPTIARHFSDKLMQRLLDLAEELRQVDAQFAAIEAAFEDAA
ncbi:MAG: cyclic nucleotide-binding domain-containing protein [Hyphomicrobiales bacterium]|nr:cyclic nucleotide-binding domain-containing protein [Hyphomicrobiales bacterium]